MCRIAVPFYFTASGFLLFRKTKIYRLNEDRIRGYCFKLLRLLGTWTFLLFVGGSEQLWYLGALVTAVIVLSFLIKKGFSLRFIAFISFILYLIGLLGDSYYGFIEPLKNYYIPRLIIVGYETIFSTTRNGILFGLIFVLIGVLFSQKRIIINSFIAILGFFTSLVLLMAEVILLKHYSHPKDFNMYILLLVVFFLFYLATHIKLKDRPIYGSLRVIGMVVFYVHLFVKFFVDLIIEIINKKMLIDLTSFEFIITIFFTTIFAILIERLSKTNKFQWLKYLYS